MASVRVGAEVEPVPESLDAGRGWRLKLILPLSPYFLPFKDASAASNFDCCLRLQVKAIAASIPKSVEAWTCGWK